MLGLVLCGGQSTRMGTDKGLLKLHAKTWAQTAVDKINALYLPVVISVNEQQYDEYATVFPEKLLVRDDLSLQVKGPLCGVLSAHIQHPDEDLFVLACDLPLMDQTILKELFHHYLLHTGHDAYLFTSEDQPEPLCSIYMAKSLSKILALHNENKLTKHSMKNMLEHLNVFSTPLQEEQKKFFRNFNAHAELNGL